MTLKNIPKINQVALSGEVQSIQRLKFETIIEISYLYEMKKDIFHKCEIKVALSRSIEDLETGKIKPGQIVFICGKLVSIALPKGDGDRLVQHRILARSLQICRQPEGEEAEPPPPEDTTPAIETKEE